MKKSNTNFSSEKKVAEWLEKMIRTDQLYDHIKNKSQIDIINDSSKNFIPVFNFDKLSRVANLQAAKEVLDSLQLLEIISIDRSVSLQKGEILRPDIVCFNPEKKIFVIFEIKRDKLTERQALTEIYAYEQEIRNILPFIGNREIQTVIVSNHWNTLLEHSVSNYNSWSNKTCLALSLDQAIDVEDKFDLSLLIPNAWYFRGVYGLPREAFQTFDLLIYKDEDEDEDIPLKISTFIRTITKQFDRNDVHGFLLLWKNHFEPYKGWGITICNIDPFAIFNFCKNNEVAFKESSLITYISEFYENNGSISLNSLGKITYNYLGILKEDYHVEYSNYTDWKNKVHNLKLYSEPLYYDFYGIVGDFATDFISNPVVRELYLPFLKNNSMDWQHPLIAPILISNLTCTPPYPNGYITCKDSFLLGSLLGIYGYLVERYEVNKKQNIESSIKWIYADILHYVVENNQFYQACSSINTPPPLLSNKHEYRLETLNNYKEWINSELIPSNEKIHNFIFNFSFETAVIMSSYFDQPAVDYFLENGSNLKNVANGLKEVLKLSLIYLYRESLLETIEFNKVIVFKQINLIEKNSLEENITIIDNFDNKKLINIFKKDQFDSFQYICSPVFHSSSATDLNYNSLLDVDDIKNNLKQLYKNGMYPAISIRQDGKIGIVSLTESELKITKVLYQDINFDNETIFIFDSSSNQMYFKKTWNELLNMINSNEHT